jgi:hypothetical protein
MNKFIKILVGAVLTMSLASCLKDKDYDDHRTGHLIEDGNVIELALNQFTAAHSQSMALDFVDVDTAVVFLTVRLASGQPAPEDITVIVDTNNTQELIDEYNLANGTSIIPFHLFSFAGSGLTVTIPAGQNEGYVRLNINPSTFDASATYGIGFRIVSVSPSNYIASQNFGTFLTLVGAKNAYDGVYELTWQNYHPTGNPGYIGSTTQVHLVTTTANSVKIYWPLVPGFFNPAVLNGGLSYFGLQEPQYSVDPSTFKVTVTNAYPGAVTFYSMNPNFDSHYDPATREFHVKWGYSYTNGDFDPALSREWIQHFTYIGPR